MRLYVYLDIIIRSLLADQPAHGYELKRRVEHHMGAAVTLNNNVLYPALHRFEEMGAVERSAEVHQSVHRVTSTC